jgi:hypothetical protein
MVMSNLANILTLVVSARHSYLRLPYSLTNAHQIGNVCISF